MENKFLAGLNATNDKIYTENGAVAYSGTGVALMDLFALGAAYRTRSDEDCILLFKKAFEENETYAMKCLFYIRDILEGQGERRFFRVCMHWLAKTHPAAVRRNMNYFAEYGRWDDLYCLIDTPLESEMFALIKSQLEKDMISVIRDKNAVSLLAKWLPSENTSSQKTRELGAKTRKALGMTCKQYRKSLSILRERINVLERLMSAGQWDKIEFDKIPSRAGMIYRNAFARHDVERMKSGAQTYEAFAKDDNSKVNAKALYPYECVDAAFKLRGRSYYNNVSLEDTQRLMVNKYWDNLADYFNDASFNGMCVVDVSGSMYDSTASAPINVAISLGLYCADKCKGPFANHFMTFSANPTFVKVEGVDFYDKVVRMSNAGWSMNTNIEAAFDLMLKTAIANGCKQEDIPENLLIISDMEFDSCAVCGPVASTPYCHLERSIQNKDTLFETLSKRWAAHGYKMPKLVFWNVNARQNNLPMRDNGYVSFISGMSPSIFDALMTGKTGLELVLEKLNMKRYEVIR